MLFEGTQVAIDSDNRLSLPDPPPPRPAARKEAIDAALRKFDGIEETPAVRRPPKWLGMDRRAFGALATAAVVAVVSVPIALDALRDLPQPPQQQAPRPIVADIAEPARETPAATGRLASPEPVANETPEAATVKKRLTAEKQAEAREDEAKSELTGFVANAQEARSEAPPALAVTAPPPAPPPPPPPPPAAPAARGQQYSTNSVAQDVVVSGSRIPQPNLGRAAPLKAIDSYGNFLSQLQAALRADDRRAVSRLVGFPLSVRKDGKVETYRSRREVERDFDEIFTPRVRSEVLDQRPYSLRTRQDGKTKGSTRLWFAPACFNAECTPPGQIRIREVTP